jgi:transcriptional regulator with XRE-family HTH domain
MSAHPTDPDGFGSLLARARRARGRSQQRLADQLCAIAGATTISRHEISRWEREERTPTPYWVDRLSTVLEIDAADLERAIARSRSHRGAHRAASGWPWRVLAADPGSPSFRGRPRAFLEHPISDRPGSG